jgi:hypothetical protein
VGCNRRADAPFVEPIHGGDPLPATDPMVSDAVACALLMFRNTHWALAR